MDNLLRSIQEAHTFHSKLALVLAERSAFKVLETLIDDAESFAPTPEAYDDQYEISAASVFVDSIRRRRNHVLTSTIFHYSRKCCQTPPPASRTRIRCQNASFPRW